MRLLLLLCSALLLIGIASLPIGYYTLLRIVVCITAGIVIHNEFQRVLTVWVFVFGIMAILFNPIIPVYLNNKDAWIPIDFICGIICLIKAFSKSASQVNSNSIPNADTNLLKTTTQQQPELKISEEVNQINDKKDVAVKVQMLHFAEHVIPSVQNRIKDHLVKEGKFNEKLSLDILYAQHISRSIRNELNSIPFEERILYIIKVNECHLLYLKQIAKKHGYTSRIFIDVSDNIFITTAKLYEITIQECLSNNERLSDVFHEASDMQFGKTIGEQLHLIFRKIDPNDGEWAKLMTPDGKFLWCQNGLIYSSMISRFRK